MPPAAAAMKAATRCPLVPATTTHSTRTSAAEVLDTTFRSAALTAHTTTGATTDRVSTSARRRRSDIRRFLGIPKNGRHRWPPGPVASATSGAPWEGLSHAASAGPATGPATDTERSEGRGAGERG